MKFLFDENLPPKLTAVMRLLHDVPQDEVLHVVEDLGQRGVADAVWLTGLSQRQQWVVITRDTQIRKRPQERVAWQQSGHVVVFLAKGWGNQRLWDQLWMFIRWWPTIVQAVSRAAPGEQFRVPAQGAPKRLEPGL